MIESCGVLGNQMHGEASCHSMHTTELLLFVRNELQIWVTGPI